MKKQKCLNCQQPFTWRNMILSFSYDLKCPNCSTNHTVKFLSRLLLMISFLIPLIVIRQIITYYEPLTLSGKIIATTALFANVTICFLTTPYFYRYRLKRDRFNKWLEKYEDRGKY